MPTARLEAMLEAVRGEHGELTSSYVLTDAQRDLHKARIRELVRAWLSRSAEEATAETELLNLVRRKLLVLQQEFSALEASCSELEALCDTAEKQVQDAEDGFAREIVARQTAIETDFEEFDQKLREIEERLDIGATRRQMDALIALLRAKRGR